MRTLMMSNTRWLALIALLLMFVGLSGCATNKKPEPDDPAYAPTIAASMPVPQRTDGSLYQDAYGLNLFNDRKAHFVGDVDKVVRQDLLGQLMVQPAWNWAFRRKLLGLGQQRQLRRPQR